MLNIGEPAPDLLVPGHDGVLRPLAKHRSGGAAIVFFYPADFTPVCTKEACMLRDVYPELEAAGYSVVGVSPQDDETHECFRVTNRLPFTLVADTERKAIRAWKATGPFGRGVRRVTYRVDAEGVIVGRVRADLRIARHEAFVRQALAVAEES